MASPENAVTLWVKRSFSDAQEDVVEARAEKHTYPPPSTTDNRISDTEKRDSAASDVVTWRNLRYVVPVAEGERQLLDDVSGYVAPGKLTALMGESGAGKTTLLNVLAGRHGSGTSTGDIFVNGRPLPADFQSQTGYCQQMDTHTPEQTVREALLFSAKLRQPADVPVSEKEAWVDTCLRTCGLEAYADAIVGTLGVEHRKHTTIAVELAARPKLLLFLDEPTSGLDSQSAMAIMRFLRQLADTGQAILCTIHQPSSELFQIFDRLLLLKKGGRTVYFGDLGKNSRTLTAYLEKKGARTCGEAENPAEWILDVIGAGATATSSIDWCIMWRESEESARVQQQIEDIHNRTLRQHATQSTLHTGFATPWFHQLRLLVQRGYSCYWRNPTYLFSKLVLNAAIGLFIGFTYFNSPNSLQGTQNKLFSIFMTGIVSLPLVTQHNVVFINIRDIYEIRERASRMYSWSALVTAQLLVELPWNIIGSQFLLFCWYWTVGFASNRAPYTILLLSVLYPAYYTTFGQAVAAASPNSIIANILFSLFFSFPLRYNGVLQPYRFLGWWKWMYRISPFTYMIEGLLGQAAGHMEITCADTEFAVLNPPDGMNCADYMGAYIKNFGGYLEVPNATSACQYCAARTTDEYLDLNFNISYANRWRDNLLPLSP